MRIADWQLIAGVAGKNSNEKKNDPNKYPKGWNARSVKRLADYYDNQSDAEGAAEIENAEEADEELIFVPKKLVPTVMKLISKHKARAG